MELLEALNSYGGYYLIIMIVYTLYTLWASYRSTSYKTFIRNRSMLIIVINFFAWFVAAGAYADLYTKVVRGNINYMPEILDWSSLGFGVYITLMVWFALRIKSLSKVRNSDV